MALMGTGLAKGEHRAMEAAQRAISSLFGTVIDENIQEEVKITVIATGFDNIGPGAVAMQAAGAVEPARQVTPRPQRELKAPVEPEEVPFFRKPRETPAAAVAGFADGQGFGPKYKEVASEDVLDVPTFLRKQFD